jgi:two-component system, OmpR family, sensor histidine kinase KdpD
LQIASLIEESIAELAQELGNHPVIIHPHARQKAFWPDRQLLKMAFCRLFDNAAKYSPPGTAINIDISEQEAEILIAVANQGSFIPQQEWDKIFQRFYRTPGFNLKAPGTGIGLSVVKQVTEAHHGRAWVSSDLEAGITFFSPCPEQPTRNHDGTAVEGSRCGGR